MGSGGLIEDRQRATVAAAPVGRRLRRRPLRLTQRFGRADLRGISEAPPARYVARRDSTFRRLLALADVVAAGIAMFVAVQVLGDDTLRPVVFALLPLVVVTAKLEGLYDRDALLVNKTTLDEAPKLFKAATLYALLTVIAQEALVEGSLSAGQVVGTWLVLFAAALACRWLARRLANRTTETERILVLGDAVEAARLKQKIEHDPHLHAEVVDWLPLANADEPTTGDALLEERVRALGVHRAMVAPGEASYDETLSAIRAAKAVGVQVSVVPRLLEVIGSSVEFDQLYGVSVLGVRRFGLTKSSEAVKRGLDLIGAALILLVLSPLLALIALGVKRSSPGPVLFRQRRVGQDGRPFELIKFRTMVNGADAMRAELAQRNEAAAGLFKIADDPRVTRFGRRLRRASLDELPQLVNVLRGDMSLVGPRPLIPEEDSQIEGQHRRRLHLKPGMTGQWQVYGSSRIPLREMVTIDYLYAANWSLWGDMKILLRTLPHVLARRGL